MNQLGEFHYSQEVIASGSALPFAMVTARDISQPLLAAALSPLRETFAATIATRGQGARDRINAYARQFLAYGYRCPLITQFDRIIAAGLPHISPLVDALLLCEMSTGTLMGVQDLDKIEGAITYDASRANETFEGMRGKVTCQLGETVLRDEAGIIASYFQGPDFRTRVGPHTRAVALFVFSAPGISYSAVDDAIDVSTTIMRSAAKQIAHRIYRPEGLGKHYND